MDQKGLEIYEKAKKNEYLDKKEPISADFFSGVVGYTPSLLTHD